jgi:hypothetical protein
MDRMGLHIKNHLKDNAMPLAVQQIVDESIDGLLPDIKLEVFRQTDKMMSPRRYRRAPANYPPKVGPHTIGTPLGSKSELTAGEVQEKVLKMTRTNQLRSFILYHLFPYDKSIWQSVHNPYWILFTTIGVLPFVGPVWWLFLFILMDKHSEHQLCNFIIGFKASQYLSLGCRKTFVGLVQHIRCTTTVSLSPGPPSEYDSNGMEDACARLLPTLSVFEAAFFVLQIVLVWLAFFMLRFSTSRIGPSKCDVRGATSDMAIAAGDGELDLLQGVESVEEGTSFDEDSQDEEGRLELRGGAGARGGAGGHTPRGMLQLNAEEEVVTQSLTRRRRRRGDRRGDIYSPIPHVGTRRDTNSALRRRQRQRRRGCNDTIDGGTAVHILPPPSARRLKFADEPLHRVSAPGFGVHSFDRYEHEEGGSTEGVSTLTRTSPRRPTHHSTSRRQRDQAEEIDGVPDWKGSREDALNSMNTDHELSNVTSTETPPAPAGVGARLWARATAAIGRGSAARTPLRDRVDSFQEVQERLRRTRVPGGKLMLTFWYETVCVLLSIVLTTIVLYYFQYHQGEGSAEPRMKRWQAASLLYWVQCLYGMLSFPFVLFKIPIIRQVLTHTSPVGYDQLGFTVLQKKTPFCPPDNSKSVPSSVEHEKGNTLTGLHVRRNLRRFGRRWRAASAEASVEQTLK